MKYKEVVGIIFLGVLSAIIYDFVKPIFNFILTQLIFLSNFIEKDIYYNISLGLHEKYSVVLFALIYLFPFILVLGHIIRRKTEKGIESIKDIKKEKYFIYILLVIMSSLSFYITFKEIYINDKITCFNNKINILAPYITEKEKLIYISRFSLIKSKKDYNNIIDDFERDGNKFNLKKETFGICKDFDYFFNLNGY